MVRMLLGRRRMTTEWQVGDGRELALARHVEAEARRGDIDDVIRVIDDFAYHRSFLVNVGDEKGEILDAAIRRTPPRLLLELGTYCGYSALRAARVMPDGARLVSIEFNAGGSGRALLASHMLSFRCVQPDRREAREEAEVSASLPAVLSRRF